MYDVSMLIQALPYIRQFRDKLFVVKFGGELLQDPEHLDAIASDLTLISMVGIRLVVVHGGGPQANELSETLGFRPQLVNGRRVTDEAALEVAKMVFAGKINTELLSALHKHGGRGVGLSGIDGGLVRAHKRPVTTIMDKGEKKEIDFGYVGDVDGVDPTVVLHLVAKGFIPVVSSLGVDEQGVILNINADTIAAELAAAVNAEKLIVMTNVAGVYRDFSDKTSIISSIRPPEVRRIIETGAAGDGMGPKLEACVRAVEHGVHEAHIINGLTRHSLLLEIFTNAGVGTMVVPSDRAIDK
jgi:acetylglutamate kinase